MTVDEILAGLFPAGHDVVVRSDKLIMGAGRRGKGGTVEVIGIADGEPLGIDGVLPLAERVLRVIAAGGDTPILVMVDTRSQRMARRDEMLGLNEYLAHLAKCLLLASREGHRTVGLNHGKAAAGAFLATGLATDILVALPGAEPAVMDLPSMARVTKLPEDTLRVLSQTTPVFAPGLASMTEVGAVAEIWDPREPLGAQLEAALAGGSGYDARDDLGAARGGRRVASELARRVAAQATGDRHAATS
ncbi:biotin-independent malonate decarboxylase subunit gamma [Inquilinus sp. OTU3971]|uniref:biotin-independent malonate decarboxylase subunit gamma n=1 Tax=Inquilinus sp. OTU3971 TaxID=3043855 RepID=UPI00313A9CD8